MVSLYPLACFVPYLCYMPATSAFSMHLLLSRHCRWYMSGGRHHHVAVPFLYTVRRDPGRPSRRPGPGDVTVAPDLPAATPPPPSGALAQHPAPATSSSSAATLGPSSSSDVTGSSTALAYPSPPPRRKAQRSSTRTPHTAKSGQPPVVYLRLCRSPLLSTQPPLPRRLTSAEHPAAPAQQYKGCGRGRSPPPAAVRTPR